MATPFRFKEVSWRRKVWYAFDIAWLSFELYTAVMARLEPHKPDDTFSATHRDAWALTELRNKILFATFLGWLQAHAFQPNRPVIVVVPTIGTTDEGPDGVQ